jgi:hypothetical protein
MLISLSFCTYVETKAESKWFIHISSFNKFVFEFEFFSSSLQLLGPDDIFCRHILIIKY